MKPRTNDNLLTMNARVLKLYHGLPGPLRSVAATLRGRYLRGWRYGPETDGLVAQALERDYWTSKQWDDWRSERLAYVLHRAATRVPYYREQWATRRRNGDHSSWAQLKNWPVLEKDTVHQHGYAFIADDRDVRRMFHERTGGTTGKPIYLWWSRDAVRGWYALYEARCRAWYGVSRHDRWAMFSGQLVTAVGQQKAPFWVWNHALNQLYLSSFHLAPAYLPSYVDAIRRYGITHLCGYPSALTALAYEVCRQRTSLPMKVVITNAEPVFDHQRQVMTEAFQGPVCESYGLTEIVTCGSECGSRRMHSWPEVGVTEVVPDLPDAGEASGELLGTSLLNPDMPLIRYRTGDRATLAGETDPCACGRLLPTLASIDGRSDDVIYTRDGRQVGRLDSVFKAQLPVREAQIIQETPTRVRVRLVPEPNFTHASGELLTTRLRYRLGDMDVVLEPVSEIPRTSRGKFKAVVCQLSAEERQRLRG